jgi:Flp pilus assembly protein TadG
MLNQRLFRRLRRERGQTAVEFALVAPILIALLLGVVQAGIAFHNYLSVTDASRALARKAILVRFTPLTQTQINQIADNASPDLDPSQLTATVTPDPTDPTFTTAGSTITVTVTYPYHLQLFGIPVIDGTLTSTMLDRLE